MLDERGRARSGGDHPPSGDDAVTHDVLLTDHMNRALEALTSEGRKAVLDALANKLPSLATSAAREVVDGRTYLTAPIAPWAEIVFRESPPYELAQLREEGRVKPDADAVYIVLLLLPFVGERG
jgi:hypothetical protein